MATSVKTVADRVFNLLKGYGFQIDTYNKEGEVVGDPAEAIRFFVEDPNLLVTLNVPKEEIRLSISANTDQTDTLRNQLSEIAKDYLMMLDFRVFGKTLKPSSEAINISRESDMKEHNRMRKLAGLETLTEERAVVGCNDDQSLYMFMAGEEHNLGTTPEEIASKLKELDADFEDMYYSSTMDFATECGFETDESAKDLMDNAMALMNDVQEEKNPDGHHHTSNEPFIDPEGPGADELDPGQEEDEKSNLMSFLNLELDSMDNSKIASEIGMLLQYVLPNYGGNGPQSEYGRMLDGVWDALGSDAKGTVDSDADMGFADSRVDTMDLKLSDEDVESLKQAQAEIKGKQASTDENVELNDLRKRAGLDVREVEEGKLPAGLQAYQDKKNGKKDDADKDDKEVDEDKEEVEEGKNCGCGQNPCKTYGTVKENVEETIVVEASLGSMRGSIKTSNQPLGGTKIIVKHTKAVNEEIRGSRSRNIQKIFIENNEERFLFPSKNLNGARAMARHLHNGGQMHDTIGESIVAMCTELKTLKEFANYVKKQGLINEENNDYVELARQHISTIKETFKKLSGVKTYSKAVESLKDMNNIDIVNEVNLEDHFTETHFDDKVGSVHETISKLVNKQTAFESMIMQNIEEENFAGIKELISEDPMDFATPQAKLGHQVSQLGTTATNPQLANYLGSISNKLSNGGQMNQFEYRAVKASLLSAQRTDHAEMAHTVTEEEKYTDFINSFIKD